MRLQLRPGRYYMNPAGQLVKVRLLLFIHGRLARVLIEHLDGRCVSVAPLQTGFVALSEVKRQLSASQG